MGHFKFSGVNQITLGQLCCCQGARYSWVQFTESSCGSLKVVVASLCTLYVASVPGHVSECVHVRHVLLVLLDQNTLTCRLQPGKKCPVVTCFYRLFCSLGASLVLCAQIFLLCFDSWCEHCPVRHAEVWFTECYSCLVFTNSAVVF